MIKRLVYYGFFRILDVLLAVLLLPIWLILLAALKGKQVLKKKQITEVALLHISSSSSMDQVLRKFGSLDFLFKYDGAATAGVFTRNIVFWFPAEKTIHREFNHGWTIIQHKLFCGKLSIIELLCVSLKIINSGINYNVRVVRGWGSYLSGFLAWLVSAFLGVPFCVSVHADYYKREQLERNVIPRYWGSLFLTEILEKIVYKKADLVCPIRESLIPLLLEKGCNADKIRIFPHGIDLTGFQNLQFNNYIHHKYGLGKDKKILSMAGRLEKENYVYDYISMAKQLRQRRTDWLLIMAGEGREKEELIRQIKEYELTDFVLMTGYLPQPEVFKLRANSYINLCFMAGFSLLEACASGRPVITYDVEWHYELISNDKTGVIVPEHSLNEVVKAVVSLFGHPEIADRLGAAAKRVVFAKYDIDKNSELKKKVYQELLARR